MVLRSRYKPSYSGIQRLASSKPKRAVTTVAGVVKFCYLYPGQPNAEGVCKGLLSIIVSIDSGATLRLTFKGDIARWYALLLKVGDRIHFTGKRLQGGDIQGKAITWLEVKDYEARMAEANEAWQWDFGEWRPDARWQAELKVLRSQRGVNNGETR